VVPAIVLAAGASTRMGRPKALLPSPGGRLFVTRIVRTLTDAGVPAIVIVTGARHEAIAEAVRRDDPPLVPQLVRNPNPSRGQLSSLLLGLDTADSPATEAVLVTLVDVPAVSATTVRAVIEAWQRTRAPLVRPAIGDEHGHPVIFDRRVFDELRQAPLEGGAKVVVRAHERELVNVPVDDRGCLVDVDTPDDYEALRRGTL
jgi:molybdenum cofactor cytidylyltransferase